MAPGSGLFSPGGFPQNVCLVITSNLGNLNIVVLDLGVLNNGQFYDCIQMVCNSGFALVNRSKF